TGARRATLVVEAADLQLGVDGKRGRSPARLKLLQSLAPTALAMDRPFLLKTREKTRNSARDLPPQTAQHGACSRRYAQLFSFADFRADCQPSLAWKPRSPKKARRRHFHQRYNRIHSLFPKQWPPGEHSGQNMGQPSLADLREI